MKMKIIIIALVMLLFIQSAHAEQEIISGNYKIIFRTEPENADTGLTKLIISLEDKENGKRVSNFVAALKIKDGNSVIFSSDAMELDETGSVTLNYNFEKSGNYVVEFNIDDLNVSSSFRFGVGHDDNMSILLLLIVIIAVSVFLLWKRRAVSTVKEETV
jgi:hypothetical protein